ncbi:myozenin-1 [Pelobates fuscus]|uniref:myozenin-1 n=1 Tax=Pelobates fuscus TaxID=191477 RepID=UPI002FE4C3C1
MPLSGTPAPNKRKKSTKILVEISSSREEEQVVSRLNLGKKISVPRDIMLEELSLLSNKGSKMFKLRQKRVEKFIYENNPDVFSDNSVDHFQKFIATGGDLGPGGHTGVGGGGYGLGHGGGRMVSSLSGGQHGHGGHQPPIPPPKPGSKGGVGGGQAGDSSSGGKGGREGIDGSGGKDGHSGQDGPGGKHITIFKTYLSPWDKAMGIDPQQASNLNINLLDYCTKAELVKYKSFNRSAMPFGGYDKAAKLMTFQMPEFDAGPVESEPEIVFNAAAANRPSFNRTPVGWLGSGEGTHYNIDVPVPLDGETEEL